MKIAEPTAVRDELHEPCPHAATSSTNPARTPRLLALTTRPPHDLGCNLTSQTYAVAAPCHAATQDKIAGPCHC